MQQVTKWLKLNENIRLGKVKWSGDKGMYYVPCPHKIISAREWCKNHAKQIGGIVKRRGIHIAVFKEDQEC